MNKNKDLELIVENPKDFAIFKEYSYYSSELTGVCVLMPAAVVRLNEKHPGLLSKYVNQETKEIIEEIPKATVVLKDGKMFVENADIEILSYLNVRSTYNTEVKIVDMGRLIDLIEEKIIEVHPSMEFINKPMHFADKIVDLHTAKGRMRFRGKLWSLEDHFGACADINSLDFGSAKITEKRLLVLKDLKVMEFDKKNKIVKFENPKTKQKYEAKFYYIPPILEMSLGVGRDVTIASQRAYGNSSDSGVYKLIEPMVVPRGYSKNKITLLKSPRTIPSAIYNSAYREYLHRYSKYLKIKKSI